MISPSGRVPGRASEPSRDGFGDDGGYGALSSISSRVSRVFPRRRIYGRRGGVDGALVGPDTGQARAQVWPRLGVVWPPPGSAASSLLAPASLRRNKVLDFCPVQFQEYFLYNFSEIQKQQKIGTGTPALVNRLVPEKC